MKRLLLLFLCLLTAVFATFAFSVVFPSLPGYLDRLGYGSGIPYAVAVGVFPLATAISSPIFPILERYISQRMLYIFAYLISVMSMVPYGYVNNFYAIVVLRFLWGITAGLTVFGRKSLFDVAGKDIKKRVHFMVFFTAAMGLGYALGPIIGAALLYIPFNQNACVGIFTAIFAFILGVMAFFTFDPADTVTELQPINNVAKPPEKKEDAPPPVELHSFSPQYLLLYTINSFGTIIFISFVAIAVPSISGILGWSEGEAGYIEGIIGVAYVICAFTNSLFMSRFGIRLNLTIALLASLLGSAIIASWDRGEANLARIIVGCIATGFGYSMVNSLTMQRTGEIAGKNEQLRQSAFAVLTMIMAISRILGSILTGILIYFDDDHYLYYINVGLAILSVCCVLGLKKKSKI